MKWYIFICLLTVEVVSYGLTIWTVYLNTESVLLKKIGYVKPAIALFLFISLTTYYFVTHETEKQKDRKDLREDVEYATRKAFEKYADSNFKELHHELHLAYQDIGRKEKIIEQLKNAITRQIDNRSLIEQLKSNGDLDGLLRVLIEDRNNVKSQYDSKKEEYVCLNREIVSVSVLMGELETAMIAINQILEIYPDDIRALCEKGYVYHRLGNLDEAENAYLESIDKSKNELQQASAMIGTGIFYSRIAKHQKAIKLFSKSLDIGNKTSMNNVILSSSLNLALGYHVLGEIDTAQDFLLKAEIASVEIGDKILSAAIQVSQATFYQHRGEHYKAIEIYEKALETLSEAKIPHAVSTIYTNLGNVYSDLGNLDRAEYYYLEALKIDHKHKSENSMAINYGNMGIIYKNRGDLENAEKMQHMALPLHKKLGDSEGEARVFANLGVIYSIQKKYDQSESAFMDALVILEPNQPSMQIAQIYGNLGTLKMECIEFDKAKDYLNSALNIFQDIKYLQGMAMVYFNLASICKEQDNPKDALKHWSTSKSIYENIGLPHMIQMVQEQIDNISAGDDSKNTSVNRQDGLTEFLYVQIRCRILNGVQFVLAKDTNDTQNDNIEPYIISFSDASSLIMEEFIRELKSRLRTHYSSMPKNYGSADEFEKSTPNKRIIEIIIHFPDGATLITTSGLSLSLLGASTTAEISTNIGRFGKFEIYSLDYKTIGAKTSSDIDVGKVSIEIATNIADRKHSKLTITGEKLLFREQPKNHKDILPNVEIYIRER